MSKVSIDRDTLLCMSLSARPGNFGTRFQNHLYEALDLNYVYKAFSTTDLAGAIGGIRALGVRGCAVSAPFKETCIPLLDALHPSAEAIGAVNTIVNDDGRLKGFNTDYIAIRKLLERHGVSPATPFALRGGGGMAKATAAALRDAGFREGMIVARNEIAGRALAERCGYGWSAELDRPVDMLINATPIGMAGGAGEGALAFSEAAIMAARIVFDAVALPLETPLVVRARAAGKLVIGGDDVLVLQGLEQFILYTGVSPAAELVARAAAFALA